MRKEAVDKTVIATNRKAWHDYEILQEWEAGLQLKGGEVKSLRSGKVSLDGCFAKERGGELYLVNLYISPYRFTTTDAPEPRRDRKLLMHKTEVGRALTSLRAKRLTVVPLELYFRRGWAKVRMALARGRKERDVRDDIKRKTEAREMDRSFKGKFKG
ncbi:MAG: SsrA-binding protein SmpB [Elusimicrobia bacterium]|nr:SsrA-binding protein SmpB [Elusimicrobiota bacterium]